MRRDGYLSGFSFLVTILFFLASMEAMHVTSSTGCAAIVEISTASTLDLTGLLSVVTLVVEALLLRWSTTVMCTVVQTSWTERLVGLSSDSQRLF